MTLANREETKAQTAAIAARLKAAVLSRVEAIRSSVPEVAAGIGKDHTAVYAWMNGTNRFYFQDVLQLDCWFAARGLPGLIGELMSPEQWRAETLDVRRTKMPKRARALLDIAPALRGAGRGLFSIMAEYGMLAEAHVMAVADDAVTVVHCGEQMHASVSPSVIGRDVRTLNDKAYGHFIHATVPPLVASGLPAVQRITSPSLSYSRVGVPVDGNRYVALAFDHQFSGDYCLQ